MQCFFLLATALALSAAAPQPATLGPPTTGSMYNGNNAHSPQLQPSQVQAANQGQNNEDTTGAHIPGGQGAAHGAGGSRSF